MTLTTIDIEDRLRRIIAAATGGPLTPADSGSDIPLLNGGVALNSVALLQVVVGIEEEFSIMLDEATLSTETFESLATLAKYVQTQMRGNT